MDGEDPILRCIPSCGLNLVWAGIALIARGGIYRSRSGNANFSVEINESYFFIDPIMNLLVLAEPPILG